MGLLAQIIRDVDGLHQPPVAVAVSAEAGGCPPAYGILELRRCVCCAGRTSLLYYIVFGERVASWYALPCGPSLSLL